MNLEPNTYILKHLHKTHLDPEGKASNKGKQENYRATSKLRSSKHDVKQLSNLIKHKTVI